MNCLSANDRVIAFKIIATSCKFDVTRVLCTCQFNCSSAHNSLIDIYDEEIFFDDDDDKWLVLSVKT